MLKVQNISKSYKGEAMAAVNDISFEVKSGELLSLVGESGSGKTTLLRLIAGLERPDKGTISNKGTPLASDGVWMAPEKRKIGLVFQGGALFPHMDVAANVAYGLGWKGGVNNREVVLEYLDLVKLADKSSRYPHELSAGERQRVALIRALAPSPDLILLDEPFSNLDVRLTKELREEMRTLLKKRAITAVLVTHDSEDARDFADRIAILRKGKLVQIATTEQVVNHPCNEYCALLVRSSYTPKSEE